MKQIGHLNLIDVSLDLGAETLPIGRLAWRTGERRSYFEYGDEALDAKFALSPFGLPLKRGAQPAPNAPFDGLHGLFNDSLPDGWGRKLLDRRIQKMGYDYTTLSPMDRLSFVGNTGMGALRYAPVGELEDVDAGDMDLDWFADQAELAQAESPAADVERLQAAQGGSGGVRPKVVIGLDPDSGLIVSDRNQGLPAGFEPWIVKFRSEQDPKEIGPEEYAYSLMAKAAGIEMPPTRILLGGSGAAYFAVRRFDRTPDGPIHMHTLSGLLHADHRALEIDYTGLLKATRLLTRDERYVEVMVRRMVFNVLARNRDDHSKNHAFLMATDGHWFPSPAYDLTFSQGPGGEHNMAIAGEGRNPTAKHLVAEAAQAGLTATRANQIIEEVQAAISTWRDHAGQAGLSAERTDELSAFLR